MFNTKLKEDVITLKKAFNKEMERRQSSTRYIEDIDTRRDFRIHDLENTVKEQKLHLVLLHSLFDGLLDHLNLEVQAVETPVLVKFTDKE